MGGSKAEFLSRTGRLDMASQSQEMMGKKDLATKSSELDFAIVLSRVIASIESDPAQLRGAVYELARIKLQTELSINASEKRDLALALESAIERVETVSSKHDRLKVLQALGGSTNRSEAGLCEIWTEARVSAPTLRRVPNLLTRDVDGARKVEASRHWMAAAPLVRVGVVAVLGIVFCTGLDRHFGIFGRQSSQPFASVAYKVERPEAKQIVQASADGGQTPITTPSTQSLGFPRPSVYGIYAVSGGRLHELEPLAGRVPDQRVFMSTPVKTPSRTVLPDGRAVFIIYRGDAANGAPERVSVRVIAKVLRAMTFNTAGQASTANVQDTWTIRNISYDFRVAPVGEGSEMLMITPEREDFEFPPGRYGLVIKGQAYDFTIAGPITEPAQCLEGIKAENGTFYSECRRPWKDSYNVSAGWLLAALKR
jgi:hypothetical protein